jgi:aryl-alcohol dehydrogenase-like predicted oxidoreductase
VRDGGRMQYTLLGRSGLRVSELCLGTGGLGVPPEVALPQAPSLDESRAIVKAFVDAGGNFLDTANIYAMGGSERLLGDVIAGDREWFVVGTKYTLSRRGDDPNAGGNHRKSLRQSLDESLRRLRTDYVDLFWVHGWDFTTDVDEVLRALDDAVRAGKVLHVGASSTPAWIVARGNALADCRGWTPFTAITVQYSLVERSAERELLPMARALNVGVTAWSPLGMGVLTGKYNAEAAEGERGRLDNPRLPLQQLKSDRNLAIAAEVAQIGREIGRSSSQVALAWLRAQGVVPVLGARTAAQLAENLGCGTVTLDAGQLARLDGASRIERGYPHDFLETEARPYIFGTMYERIVGPHRPH